MTDLEITRLCAEAMDIGEIGEAHNGHAIWVKGETLSGEYVYAPLEKDGQAMALVKKFGLSIEHWDGWTVSFKEYESSEDDLNRAICECVAKMESAK